ncbi:MAG: murein biosynthesis integral membrane protein MurJ [Candidatus Sungbacteria bacterium]|nr:murein biosynthesis integral membrane protein MurJ [Candidatus Sungbacteria bacterium]
MRLDIFNRQISSIHGAALIIGAAGFLSRVLGLLRDRLLASQFGASRELDIYYAAFQIPDFMTVLFLLGAGSAAILPIFQEYLGEDRKAAEKLISDLFTVFLAGSGIFALFAFFLAPFLAGIVAPGFSSDELSIVTELTRIMLFAPILFGISGIFTSVVESHQRFFAYALAPILYNVGIISGIVFFVPLFGVLGLAFGVLSGAALHLGTHFVTVKNLGFAPRVSWSGISTGVKKVVALSFPRVLAVSFSQLTIFALVALGSTLAAGSIAVFQFAQNIYFIPIGIFGASYAVVLFPRLSRAYISRDADTFFQELFLGIRSILFWILPSIALFIVLRAHIVRVALGAGAFSWEDTRLTAAVLAVLTVSLFANAIISLLIKGFYALENTWAPLFINIAASLLSVISALFFIRLLGGASPFGDFIATRLRVSDLADIRVLGLSLGLSLGFLVNVLLLYGALKRLTYRRFGERKKMPLRDLGKIVFSSLLAGIAAYLVRVSFSETLPLITFIRVLVQGIAAGGVGILVYFSALFVLRESSARSLWQTVRERMFKIRMLPASWNGEAHINQHRL